MLSKFDTVKKVYADKGVKGVFWSSYEHFLMRNPASPYLKRILGDRIHQKLYMYKMLGYWPNIRNPRTFNEKLMHRKLYTDREVFTEVEDKWRARDYIKEKIGGSVLPDLYHVTDDPETIPFDSLPDEYVVKPNHLSSGKIFLIEDGERPDREEIINRCKEWLGKKHGSMKGEYWYQRIEPKIMVEERIEEEGYEVPLDYKFFVFNGRVEAIHVTLNRKDSEKTTRTFYDRNWDPIDVKFLFDRGPDVPKPENLDEMIEVAEKIAEDFDHIRVDLYSPNHEEVIFGEMTVAESSGETPFVPREYDFKFGSLWEGNEDVEL